MNNLSKNQQGSIIAMMTAFFAFFGTALRIYLFKEQKELPPMTAEENKGDKMPDSIQTVDVVLKVPKAEKDVIDAAMLALADFKANKGSMLIADELPSIMKIIAEIGELMAEMKSKQSAASAAYLAQQLLGI